MAKEIRNVLVTGGAGYVGAVLVPKLLSAGYHVKVLDLYMYGEDVLSAVKGHPNLIEIKGDIRDTLLLEKEMPQTDAIIHLACISNDPSYELNPDLSKTINYDAFLPLVDISKRNNVKRFIFASSSSVYGVKEDPNVTEELSLDPLTDYSKYKALCEDYLLKQQSENFTTLILRPATVCGYSPRLRLDLTVNILTTHAICNNKIIVFGGDQKRPNIHIDDISDLYVESLSYPKEKIEGKIFNCGYENHTVLEIANMVKNVVGREDTKLEVQDSNDKRSYSISSKKIKKELGFSPERNISQAIEDLKKAFEIGLIKDALNNPIYYNIKTMLLANMK
ncbi:MAG: SDR family oxidoreductase [Candidatus Omnitrophica bacterium]|nr:SDR family oxidoreductase [Candidatus Omnitrophota bacterium]